MTSKYELNPSNEDTVLVYNPSKKNGIFVDTGNGVAELPKNSNERRERLIELRSCIRDSL